MAFSVNLSNIIFVVDLLYLELVVRFRAPDTLSGAQETLLPNCRLCLKPVNVVSTAGLDTGLL